VQKLLGKDNYPGHNGHPLTVAFAVGGAGAQRELAVPILRALSAKIKSGLIKVILVAGNRREVADYFEKVIKQTGLSGHRKFVSVLVGKTKQEYFDLFNDAMHTIDALWTKPSELSFYSALGIPIIIAPTIGSQEDFNSWWLRSIGGGIPQLDPAYCDEWLDDWLVSGWLARAAVAGFTNAPKRGTYRIEEIVTRGKSNLPEPIEPV
jgi:RNA-binding protein YhbY